MGIFDKIGDIATGAVNAGTLGLAGKVVGSTQNHFQANPYEVDGGAYNDPFLFANQGALTQANADRQQMATPQAQAASAQAAAAQGPNFGQSDQIRSMQLGGLQGLSAAANGAVPSAAELQGRQQLAQALQAQQGMAASMRGVSPALANHMAAQQGAQMQASALGNAAQLRANEQASARNAFANALQGARGQDLGAAGMQQEANLANAGFQQQANLANAGYQQQTGLANQQAALQAQQQKDQMAQFYDTTRLGLENNQFNANMAWDQAKQNAFTDAMNTNAGISQANTNAKTQMIGGVLGAGGQAGAALFKSDERAKEQVDRKNSGRDIDSFIKALDTASWNYKQGVGEDTNKRHWGVMAQSLAKTDVGRSMIVEDDDGLLNIDTRQGFGAVLAAQKRLNDRLEALEKVRKGA